MKKGKTDVKGGNIEVEIWNERFKERERKRKLCFISIKSIQILFVTY
jgi:hypothetical protein